MEPQARGAHVAHLDKNMIDKDEYPRTAELEQRCVNMISRLWNSTGGEQATGTSTTGSSEAAMLARAGVEVAVAGAAAQGRPAHRPAEPRHGRQRADLLGEVLPLLGGRAAPGAARGRRLSPHGATEP